MLEVMLVLVVLAATASLVITAFRNPQGASGAAALVTERLDEILQYASDWSAMRGKPLGLNITHEGWQLLELSRKQWRPFSDGGRLSSAEKWNNNWYIELRPQEINANQENVPQIVILPDGAITPFSLTIHDNETRKALSSLTSAGFFPLNILYGVSGQ